MSRMHEGVDGEWGLAGVLERITSRRSGRLAGTARPSPARGAPRPQGRCRAPGICPHVAPPRFPPPSARETRRRCRWRRRMTSPAPRQRPNKHAPQSARPSGGLEVRQG